ncbi:MAG: chaperonin GroEL [Methanobrevibacter sp.]|nr:chaperonin GroEL [Methanobrevibacter sp.]
MSKEILFDVQAREKIMQGVNVLADSVKVTLGPSGKNVMIANGSSAPTVTKDGVTVAKSIELEDAFANQGVQMLKEGAQKTNDIAGDGTTTVTVLTQAIAREGLKNIAAGANPMEIKTGIDKTVTAIVKKLDEISIKVTTTEAVAQVGTISANGDTEIGNMIANAMEKVGQDGVITVEESRTADTVLDVVEGMQFGNGYLSPYFVTNPEKMEVELDNPLILLYNHKISSVQDILSHLEFANANKRAILIIAEDVDSEALSTLVINKMRGAIKVCAVKAPGYGDSRTNNLKDIATVVGGELISDELGIKLSDADPQCMGTAKTVKITRDSTTIIEGAGTKEDINQLVAQLKNQLSETDSVYEKEKLQERIAKLAGGVGVIKVGAATEVEMNEKKDRVDDALHATKAAVEEGIVAGGGTALIRATEMIKDSVKFDNEDQLTGGKIVFRAIEEPLRQIVANAGKEPSVILNKVKELSGNQGYDARADKFYDLVENGIIDPVKVTKNALKNASSIASMILTTNCVIVEKKEEKPELPPMPMGIPGMM